MVDEDQKGAFTVPSVADDDEADDVDDDESCASTLRPSIEPYFKLLARALEIDAFAPTPDTLTREESFFASCFGL